MYASGREIIAAYNSYEAWLDMQIGSFTSEAMILYNPETEQNELFVSIDPYNHEIDFSLAFDGLKDEVEACSKCGLEDAERGHCIHCCNVTFSLASVVCYECDLYDECMNHIMSL